MRQRKFVKLVAAMIAWPIVAGAQKPMPVIGYFGLPSPGVLTVEIGFAFSPLLARADEAIE
jgi:hypothetical protein